MQMGGCERGQLDPSQLRWLTPLHLNFSTSFATTGTVLEANAN
jgi:hypothetical protein